MSCDVRLFILIDENNFLYNGFWFLILLINFILVVCMSFNGFLLFIVLIDCILCISLKVYWVFFLLCVEGIKIVIVKDLNVYFEFCDGFE